jgi:Domain of unknown function (DUF4919)
MRQLFCLFGVLLMAAQMAGAQGANPADAKYQALLERVKNGDTRADIGELRLDFAASSGYTQDTDSDLFKEMIGALNKKDFAAAIASADKALEEYYVDIDAHQVLYIAYRETNVPDKAKFHQNIVQALLDSILKSGDGKSTATAYTVISTREEYIILQVRGLKPEKQSIVTENHHQYDTMDAVDQKGEKQTLYFNIDLPMGALARDLKLK